MERQLGINLKKTRLIGEINPSRELIQQLGEQFHDLFKNGYRTEVIDIIRMDLPYSFLTFMVGMGIYNYDREGLWPAINKILGVSNQNDLGLMFERLLKHYGFPLFETLKERSLRYITPLLLHGGIPLYCLSDFFEYIVLPSLQRPEYIGLKGVNLIDEMLESSSVQNHVDKPVQYFLKFGGETAADVLSRSRRMAKVWLESKEIFDAGKIGLPVHIVNSFYDWIKENENKVTKSRSATRNRIQKPEICLDPWGMGIFIRLPSQNINDSFIEKVEWRILFEEQTKIITSYIKRNSERINSQERLFIPTRISDKYRVELEINESSFSWVLPGLSSDKPLLVFNPDQEPAPLMRNLFAREVWLLRSRNSQIKVTNGKANCLEEFPDLPGVFEDFRAECWDFSEADEIELIEPGKDPLNLPIRRQEYIPQPELRGGFLLNDNLFQDEIPFYIGKAPKLFLPTSSEYLSLDLWELYISTGEESTFKKNSNIALANLPEDVFERLSDGNILINLNHERLLGDVPFGKFELHVKGPLGMDADFKLNILSGLHPFGLEKIYMAEEGMGSPKVKINLQHFTNDHIEPANQTDAVWIDVKSKSSIDVVFQPKRHSFSLVYVHQFNSDEAIRIPFHIRIKRLRWRYISGDTEDENWNEWPITLNIHEFNTAQTPFLLLDLPIKGDELSFLKMLVTNQHGDILSEQKLFQSQITKRSKRFWRIDLSSLGDLIRLNDAAVIRGSLLIELSSSEIQQKVPVFRVIKQLDIQITNINICEINNYFQVDLFWHERIHQINRVAYFWSIYRPWEPPVFEKIPDNAVDNCSLLIPKKTLAGSQYLIEVEVLDPWLPIMPTIIPEDNNLLNLIKKEFYSPFDRLKQLKNDSVEYNQFSSRLEAFLLKCTYRNS